MASLSELASVLQTSPAQAFRQEDIASQQYQLQSQALQQAKQDMAPQPLASMAGSATGAGGQSQALGQMAGNMLGPQYKLTTPDGEKFIVDLKSTNRIPNENPFNYEMQLRVYQDNCPGAPDRMALLFIEKSYPHKIKTIEVLKDEESLEKVYDKWSRVRVAIKNNSTDGLRHCCNGPSDGKFLECPARNICEYWKK